MNHDITIQDVFHRFLPRYCETHNFSPQQQLTALCISKCHTPEMGANLNECESCHKKYIHYNSCKNRHCPMCQGMEVDEWIDKQQENVLDIPYFHTVFTVPEELYSLIYLNQKLLYDALYHAAHRTMAELRRWIRRTTQPGVIMCQNDSCRIGQKRSLHYFPDS